ncbi:MAG TPA: hypothetical protein VKX17_11385 [Planctomycetota bacterium]|nr:hypothetical protein [Planctomycetota bacterium]
MNWFRWTIALCMLVLTAAYCNHSINSDYCRPASASQESWFGVYTEPSEVAGFSGTYLWLRKSSFGEAEFSLYSYSDVGMPRSPIDNNFKQGEVLTDGEKLYLPSGFGYALSPNRSEKLSMHYLLTRYTRVHINGRTVLLRDDAMDAFRKNDELYDYGILIKIADDPESVEGVKEAKRESIKVLYREASKGWKDPFVFGPNER